MRFSFALLGIMAATLALAACGLEADLGPGTSTGSVEPPPAPDGAVLSFVEEGTLTLAPGEKREIAIVASPPAAYRVSFTLRGDPIDASLDRSEVLADEEGRVVVVLRAPNQATTFKLRASILDEVGAPKASVEKSVAVSDQGFGAVRVTPHYTGKRVVTGWTASVVARTTCADIAATLPDEPEGALVVTTPSPDEVPLVESAPVGPNLAVTIRAGHFAWGCVDTSALKAESTLDVKVKIFDKPLDLSMTSLGLDLAFAPDPAPYEALVGSAAELLGEAFFPKGEEEATLLLDDMVAAAPPSTAADFSARRKDEKWDALAEAHLDAHGTTLREQVMIWGNDGAKLQSPSILASLAPDAPGSARLVVKQIGSLSAEAAGLPLEAVVSWTAEADDTVLLGGSITWEPSRYAGGLALTGAQAVVPGAVEMKDALAIAADCGALASAMGGFGGCDTGCLATLCRDALGARWTKALKASAKVGQLGTISINASNATGSAMVGDAAELLGFEGLWKGTMGAGALTATVSGPIVGQTIAPPP